MGNEVSVFIMDVRNSSKIDIGDEISNYLQQFQVSLAYWSQNIVTTKVIHRAGDELVVVCNGFASAYTLAFYLSRIWKFREHPPYFGLSFGRIEEELNTLNIETWINPLMKEARLANNYLKNQEKRMQFYFKLPDVNKEASYEIDSNPLELLLNTNLKLTQEHANAQTELQSLVFSLYLILGQQNKVSKYLGRTKSTISTHMKNGKTDIIIEAFENIVQVLNGLETESTTNKVTELQASIKQNITNRLQDYLPIERNIK
ncbi:hypothetical protein [Oceanobacillus sp. CAU 1775]